MAINSKPTTPVETKPEASKPKGDGKREYIRTGDHRNSDGSISPKGDRIRLDERQAYEMQGRVRLVEDGSGATLKPSESDSGDTSNE